MQDRRGKSESSDDDLSMREACAKTIHLICIHLCQIFYTSFTLHHAPKPRYTSLMTTHNTPKLSHLRPSLVAFIRQHNPEVGEDTPLSHADLARYRLQQVEGMLRDEHGDLTTLDHEVAQSIANHDTLSADLETDFDSRRTLGERLADTIAAFGGSWTFIVLFFGLISVWMLINILPLLTRPFDPYPFILLNLVLSCLAAIQAPIIMMSQNRQEAKDRTRSQHDYQINLKAELEIRLLHEKLDHIITRQWERMAEIQRIQTELLQDLAQKNHK